MQIDFVKHFNHLIALLNDYNLYKPFYLEMEEIILEQDPYNIWPINLINFDLDDFDEIIKIMSEIEEGNKEYLKEFNNVRLIFISLLDNILKKFKKQHDCRRDWRYRCPELHCELFLVEMDLIEAIEETINYTKKPLIEIFQLMTADEKIGLKNVCRQTRLCEDIERYISVYIGM
jgi:hypothetical protein